MILADEVENQFSGHYKGFLVSQTNLLMSLDGIDGGHEAREADHGSQYCGDGPGLYNLRYPYAFTKYQKDDLAAPENTYSESKRTEIAQYADAVYYNDFVVSSIFGKFADKDALVIYLPDHGEAVYDNDTHMSGHVQEHPNRYMLEVPFLVYASPTWRAKHPDKWQAIQTATERPYMSDDLIHTLLDLLDICTPEYDATRSVVNPSYNEKRPRVVQGRNYDRSMK